MDYKEIRDNFKKMQISREILEALPEWFSITEAVEQYIRESVNHLFIAAYEVDQPVAFLCLKETGKDTLEINVMGVRKEFHRQGIGRAMFIIGKTIARSKGYSFIQVKTVQMGQYEEYDKTNLFYLSLGFKEFEVFPSLWDKLNPCQIYVIALK